MSDTLDFQPMYNAMAQANICWARIENAMASLLEQLLGYSPDHEALHIYFTPRNTETRFKIVDTMAMLRWEKYATHDLRSEWISIRTALGRAKELRNRIAHGEVQGPGRKVGEKWVHYVRLTASSFDVGRRHKEPKNQLPGMSVKDVENAAARFFWLAIRVEAMRDYWRVHSIGQQTSLPSIFLRIEENRRSSPPLQADPNQPKPPFQPQSPRKAGKKSRKPSARQRRERAMAKKSRPR
jgi:hypothetical protein